MAGYAGCVLRAGCNSPPAVRVSSRWGGSSPRAPPYSAYGGWVSRSGVIPEPTVIVRMEENRGVGDPVCLMGTVVDAPGMKAPRIACFLSCEGE